VVENDCLEWLECTEDDLVGTKGDRGTSQRQHPQQLEIKATWSSQFEFYNFTQNHISLPANQVKDATKAKTSIVYCESA
jgi:hypothetical protein